MWRKNILLAGQWVKSTVAPTQYLKDQALRAGSNRSMATKTEITNRQLKLSGNRGAVYHGQRTLMTPINCREFAANCIPSRDFHVSVSVPNSGSVTSIGTAAQNAENENVKSDNEAEQSDTKIKVVQKVSPMEFLRLHAFLPTTILGTAGLVSAAFSTLEFPLIILAACAPYFVRQCYLWTVDRPIEITCDEKNKVCQLTHIGWYGLPIWNTLTLSKDDFKRIPNTVCILAGRQTTNDVGMITAEKPLVRQSEHNRITVFPGTEQERRFVIDPNSLRGDPAVYHYFFCTSEHCVRKDERTGRICQAKPTPDNREAIWN